MKQKQDMVIKVNSTIDYGERSAKEIAESMYLGYFISSFMYGYSFSNNSK